MTNFVLDPFRKLWAWLIEEEELTVAKVTGEFHKIVANLKAVEQRELAKIGFHTSALNAAQLEADSASRLATAFSKLT